MTDQQESPLLNGSGSEACLRAEKFAFLRGEFRTWLAMSIDISIAQSSSILVGIISTYFVSKLGSVALAGVALATSMANCTGIMLIAGFTGGMDTECAQAMGAKRFHILGEVFQRALLVTSIPALFISIFWWNLELVLVSAGISRDISAEAGRYIRAFIPALWIIVVWACARRFLTTQRLTKPMLYGTLTGLCLCPLFNWLLIDRAGLKVIGAAFAADINWLVMLSATGLTILGMASMGRLSEHPTTWTGFSPQAFKHWGAFLRLAIPSCVTVVLGILAYEVVVLFSGLTKTTRGHHVDVSAFSLNFNLAMIIYAIPVSASFATAARVGAHLGAGKPENAKLVTGMGFLAVASYLFVTFTIAVFSPLRQGWSRLFADGDEHIVDLSSDLMPLAMTLTIPNNLKQILTGSLRGAGGAEDGGANRRHRAVWLLI
ncbi:hypothetical protein CYMTET_5781 [Cymbomonas tetramitiformis]|uniref:Uncharacterized protein n=1 Tax=Cymbomonas tetramitiformis TaxID=36881 RepID=A0AAE0GYG5_9CHLO|nr:hypothetical protein CYMTET_5781 [Cymbomonas tetramitiformis]